jgi:hypothetical protein
MDQGENLLALLPTVFASEPTGRFGEGEHAQEEEDGGDHLDTPGNTEDGGAVSGRGLATDVGATEGDAIS